MNPAPRQHTPGPWTVDNQYIHGPDGIRFLAVAGDGAGQANARLIAAAPELLDAAKLVLAWYEAENNHAGTSFMERVDMCRDSENALRAAIAKATGVQS